jgi:hypothetical protein
MAFLDALRAAFKGGGGDRVPLARSFTSPWSFALEPAPFDYARSVRRAFLDNPVAQRAVRLVAEGVGSAPLVPSDANALVAATKSASAGSAGSTGAPAMPSATSRTARCATGLSR